MLIMEEGNKIIGTWQHDKINGLAKVYSEKKKEGEIAIFKNGMQIRAADTNLQPCFKFYLIFSVFAMLGFWTLMALGTYLCIAGRYNSMPASFFG